MKKLLTVLLILATLITCIFLFSSCDSVSKWEMEKNPNQTLNGALEKSLSNFFSDESGFNKVLQKAENKGKYTISFESNDLMGGELTKISETLYTDKKNNQAVSKTQIVYNGEKFSATLYGKNDNLALQSESLFGNDTTLLLNSKTFLKDFDDSGLVEYLALDSETVDQVLSFYESLLEDSKLEDKEKKEKIDKMYNDIYAMMDQTVSREMVEGPDGRDRYYIVTTYSIENKNAKEICEYLFEMYLEEMEAYDDTNAETIEKEFDEFIDEFDDHIEIEIEAKVYIDAFEGTLYMATFEGEVVILESNNVVESFNDTTGEYMTDVVGTKETYLEIDGKFKITDDQISLKCDLSIESDAEEQEIEFEAELNKEVKKGNVTYDLLVTIGTDSVNVEFIDAVYEYEKDGDIKITIKLPKEVVGESTPNKIIIEGNAKVERESAKIKFDTVKYGDERIEFDLIFTVEAVDNIPEFPEEAEDIVDVSKKEWEDIVTKIMNSDIGNLIGGFSSSVQ